MSTEIHSLDAAQAINELKTDPADGLTEEEATERLRSQGQNKLKDAKRSSLMLRLISQFKDIPVLLLIAAAVASIFINDGLRDAIVIITILALKTVIAVVRENKAYRAIKELKSMSVPKAKVKREGQVISIDSCDVVVGDIVFLDTGDYVPADLRLVKCINLRIDESAITGEPLPALKKANVELDTSTDLKDRINLAFSGSIVTYGRGIGVAYATGLSSERGKQNTSADYTDKYETSLQEKLGRLTKSISTLCITICAIIFALSLVYNLFGSGEYHDLIEPLIAAISLVVVSSPKSILAAADSILTIGVREMTKANVIVKKTGVIETLGSTTVICSDKTRILTQNKMMVVGVCDAENVYEVTGVGYKAKGHIVADEMVSRNVSLMSQIGILCNNAEYDKKSASVTGDPTEGSLLVLGTKLGQDKASMNELHKRIHEIPFDSERKMMSTYNLYGENVIMNTKGAPESIISRSSSVYIDGAVVPMSDTIKKRLTMQNEHFAAEALRVLAFAYKRYENEMSIDNIEDDLTYVGMMCIADPFRDDIKESIQECQNAGVSVKMITGDHKVSALTIARTLGIAGNSEEVLDGSTVDNLTDEELAETVKTVNVFARVSPMQKVRVVAAIKANNDVVAMTGETVEDVPSMELADIGIAMGMTGSDVTRDAADLIIADDSFASIASAIGHGRVIYENIRKAAGYLLVRNNGVIFVVLLTAIWGLPLPLMASQLLLLTLLTDFLPPIALGNNGKKAGAMNKKPRSTEETILNRRIMKSVITRAVLISTGAFAAFLYGMFVAGTMEGVGGHSVAMSMCFFTLVAGAIFAVYFTKTEAYAENNSMLPGNKLLNLTAFAVLCALAVLLFVPIVANLFSLVTLGIGDIAICVILVLSTLLAIRVSR